MRTLVGCLCAFGLLLVGCTDEDGSDGLTTAVPATEAPSVTRSTGVDQPIESVVDLTQGWERVVSAVDEPWVGSIGEIEALPDGGFVALVAGPPSVMWSPDGIEWFDGDPQQLVPPYREGEMGWQHQLAATGDRVVILDHVNVGVWVGDPTTGQWELVRFDTGDFPAVPDLKALVSNDRFALVVAYQSFRPTVEVDVNAEFGGQWVVWIVDPTAGDAARHVISERIDLDELVHAASFQGNWVTIVGNGPPVLFVSPDGAAWSEHDLPEEWQGDASLWGLTAGASSIIAIREARHSYWYSNDGIEWLPAETNAHAHRSTYSNALGFIAEDHLAMVSADGRVWRNAGTVPEDMEVLTASGDRLIAYAGDDLWLWSAS